MHSIEIITLRAACGKKPDHRFMGLLDVAGDISDLEEIRIYFHADLDTDMSIHLHWQTDEPSRQQSAVGVRLAQLLKDYGLVNYDLWIEEERK
jgi:hypothetical protein